jgi:hypothetical protein
MSTIEARIVKTRDAATSMLRKLGLKAPAYPTFMTKQEDGRWSVDLPKLHEQGYGVNVKSGTKASKAKPGKAAKQPKAVKAKAAKALKTVKEKVAKEPRISVSSVAESLILAGKTNAEVWTAIKEQFKLDDTKKSYPTWYRCRLKRQGKLSEEK